MKMDQPAPASAAEDIRSLLRQTTRFTIPNMDCRNEEAAIRTRLAAIPDIHSLEFDLPQRHLTVVHALATPGPLLSALTEIGMQAALDAEPQVTPASSCGAACSSSCQTKPTPPTDAITIPATDRRNEEAATAPTSACDEGTECGPCGKPPPSLAPAARGNTTQFVITNMDCPTEEALIRKRLAKVDGIDRLGFDLMNRRLAVQHRLIEPAFVLEALREIGMKASIEREAGASPKGQATYLIEKMDCPTEEALLRKALQGMPGVNGLQFDLMSRRLTVSHSLPDAAPITAAIERLDMSPVLQDSSQPGPAVRRELGTGISKRLWLRMGAAGVLAIGAEGLAFSGMGESSLPVVTASLAAIALGGVDTLKKGWIALRTLSLNMNLLMTIAVIGAALIGQWPEAAVVIWLFGIAEMIEALSLDRARNAIRKLMDLAPETALVKQADGRWEEVKSLAPARW